MNSFPGCFDASAAAGTTTIILQCRFWQEAVMPRLPWNFNADRRRAFDVAVVLSSRRKNARQRLAGKKRVALAALKKRQRAGRTQRPGPKRGTYLIGLVRGPRPSVVDAAAEL